MDTWPNGTLAGAFHCNIFHFLVTVSRYFTIKFHILEMQQVYSEHTHNDASDDISGMNSRHLSCP